jgi:hypothetical protein
VRQASLLSTVGCEEAADEHEPTVPPEDAKAPIPGATKEDDEDEGRDDEEEPVDSPELEPLVEDGDEDAFDPRGEDGAVDPEDADDADPEAAGGAGGYGVYDYRPVPQDEDDDEPDLSPNADSEPADEVLDPDESERP